MTPQSLPRIAIRALALLSVLFASAALAHGVAEGDLGFVEMTEGPQFFPFMYLGAKHMVTGYDHILFLTGIIFYLYRLRDVAVYVTLFALGHSITLISGVLLGTQVNASLVDAGIGLSVAYKAMENLGLIERWLPVAPNPKLAVLFFGLLHGVGLATKLQEFSLSPNGLLTNLIAFNAGVEVGQMLALTLLLVAIGYWRLTGSFLKYAWAANVALVVLGAGLFAMHATDFFVEVSL